MYKQIVSILCVISLILHPTSLQGWEKDNANDTKQEITINIAEKAQGCPYSGGGAAYLMNAESGKILAKREA